MNIARFCMHCGTAILFAILVTACQTSSDKQQHQDRQANALTIPYEKHVLENGLTVLFHQDSSDPVVHVDVTYHVGSAREEYGRSGFAHLFEHMMFQGSENVADEEHIKLVTEAGGTMNGTTNRDRTNYFETVPSNHLETMLWLEADRMGFFLDGITQEKFEIQRETVKNEKQQNYDNRPYGLSFELITKALYPATHPYSWLTIGDLEDLDRATAEDLKDFFLRWYGPNNATLTIAGDIDPDETLKLVKKYFGNISRGPDVPPLSAPKVALDQDRYISYYDSNIRFPAVTMSFPTVERFHPDAPALQCLAEILGQGKGSYLYQNLVANQKAIQASASNRSDELAGEFFMFVLPYPGKSLAEFEKELRNALTSFEQNGVSDDDLKKFKARYESRFVNSLEKVSGKASTLAFHQTFADDASNYQNQMEAYLAVTKQDVLRVYNKYIKNQPSVILSILSDPKEAPAKPDNFTIEKQDLTHLNEKRDKLEYKKAVDVFDRSAKPEPKTAKLVNPPEYWNAEIKNGIKIIGSESAELPLIVIKLYLQGGQILDANNFETIGLASLTAEMLNTSTQNYSEKEIAEELEKLGSRIYVSASGQRFEVTVSTLSKHLDETLAILEEKLLRPAFKEEDFQRIQTQAVESALSSTKSASSIASSVYDHLLYGEKHIFGMTDTQMVEPLRGLSVEDARSFYENSFSTNQAEIVVVGDIKKDAFLSRLDFLDKLKSHQISLPTLPETPELKAPTLYFVDKPGAAQSEIRVGYMTDLPFDATGEYFKRQTMNFTLGGAFNSRINLNLREDKGITYGARSWFSSSEMPGPFTVSTSVKKASTALAVSEIMAEISRFRSEEISEKELTFLKQAIGQRDALKYESNQQKSSFLARIQRFNIAEGFIDEQKEIVSAITARDILTLAQKHLPQDKINILVVGDKKSVFEDLKKLDYPITELNAEGQAL